MCLSMYLEERVGHKRISDHFTIFRVGLMYLMTNCLNFLLFLVQQMVGRMSTGIEGNNNEKWLRFSIIRGSRD